MNIQYHLLALIASLLLFRIELFAQPDLSKEAAANTVLVIGEGCPCARSKGRVVQYAIKIAGRDGLWTAYTGFAECRSLSFTVTGDPVPIKLVPWLADVKRDVVNLTPHSNSDHRLRFESRFPSLVGFDTYTEESGSQEHIIVVNKERLESRRINSEAQVLSIEKALELMPTAQRDTISLAVGLDQEVRLYGIDLKNLGKYEKFKLVGGPVWSTSGHKLYASGLVLGFHEPMSELGLGMLVIDLRRVFEVEEFEQVFIMTRVEAERQQLEGAMVRRRSVDQVSDLKTAEPPSPTYVKPSDATSMRDVLMELVSRIRDFNQDGRYLDLEERKELCGNNTHLVIDEDRQKGEYTALRSLVQSYKAVYCPMSNVPSVITKGHVRSLDTLIYQLDHDEQVLLDELIISQDDLLTWTNRLHVYGYCDSYMKYLSQISAQLDSLPCESIGLEVEEMDRWLRILDSFDPSMRRKAIVIEGYRKPFIAQQEKHSTTNDQLIRSENTAAGLSKFADRGDLPMDVRVKAKEKAVSLKGGVTKAGPQDQAELGVMQFIASFGPYSRLMKDLQSFPHFEFEHKSYSDSAEVTLKIYGGRIKKKSERVDAPGRLPADSIRMARTSFPLGAESFNGLAKIIVTYAMYAEEYFAQPGVLVTPNRLEIIGWADMHPVKGVLQFNSYVETAIDERRPDLETVPNKRLAYARAVNAERVLRSISPVWLGQLRSFKVDGSEGESLDGLDRRIELKITVKPVVLPGTNQRGR